ncbi:MAG: LysM peptidoglycan-binding domain-containing protein [Hyphomicrobiales bacterium]|nr:LysM peptidoglycan-binding domain-containing protein [Hyphomicrobiales bacterium]
MITKIIAALKSNLALTLSAVGVAVVAAVAGTAGWIYANQPQVQEVEAPQTLTTPDGTAPGSQTRQARLPEAAEPGGEAPPAAVSGEPAAPGQTLPGFDIVRVQPDGGAVVAGQAEPGSKVVLFANSEPVAETKADATGSWVLVLEKPLPAGASDLWLSAEKAGSPKVRSAQSVAVVIDPNKNERPLVVVQDDAGSRVLQKPEVIAVATPTEAPQPPPAAPSAAETPGEVAAMAPQEPTQAQPPAGVGATLRVPVTIEAADYDVGGQLHMSGTAAPSATVRLYYDNNYIGDAEADSEGRWSLSFKRSLDGAAHTVRADEVAPASGDILARAEVSFIAELPESERRRLAEAAEAAKAAPPPGTQVAAATDQAVTIPDALGAPEEVVEQATPTSTEAVAESVATPPAPPAEETAPAPEAPDMAAAEPTAEPPSPALPLAAIGDDPKVPNRITVVRGDNLWRISRTFYGRGIRYTTIFQANRDQIRNPHWIYPDQVFLIPRLKSTDEAVN